MSEENVITERIDDRIGRVLDRVRDRVEEKHRLSRHELLPLGAARAVDPAGEAGDTVGEGGGDRSLLSGGVGGRWRRRRGRAVERDRGGGGEEVERVNSVSPVGADSGVADLGKGAGFKVLVERLGSGW